MSEETREQMEDKEFSTTIEEFILNALQYKFGKNGQKTELPYFVTNLVRNTLIEEEIPLDALVAEISKFYLGQLINLIASLIEDSYNEE